MPHDQVIQWTKAKVLVYSDSVLCLGKMNERRDAIRRWEGQVEEFKMSLSFKELLGIGGEAIGFEWHIFPGFTSLQILQRIQNDLQERNVEPEKNWRPKHLHVDVQRHRLNKNRKRWNFVLQSQKKSRCAGTLEVPRSWRRKEVVWKYKLQTRGKWNSITSQMVQRFKETGHQVFTSASDLNRGNLRKL